jgi:hypothetical protein
MKSEHTKGEAKSVKRFDKNYDQEVFDIDIEHHEAIASTFTYWTKKGEAEANAQLMIDAFNVTNETNKTPRELQKSHDELLEALKLVRLELGQIPHNWDYRAKTFMSSVDQAIKNAKQ